MIHKVSIAVKGKPSASAVKGAAEYLSRIKRKESSRPGSPLQKRRPRLTAREMRDPEKRRREIARIFESMIRRSILPDEGLWLDLSFVIKMEEETTARFTPPIKVTPVEAPPDLDGGTFWNLLANSGLLRRSHDIKSFSEYEVSPDIGNRYQNLRFFLSDLQQHFGFFDPALAGFMQWGAPPEKMGKDAPFLLRERMKALVASSGLPDTLEGCDSTIRIAVKARPRKTFPAKGQLSWRSVPARKVEISTVTEKDERPVRRDYRVALAPFQISSPVSKQQFLEYLQWRVSGSSPAPAASLPNAAIFALSYTARTGIRARLPSLAELAAAHDIPNVRIERKHFDPAVEWGGRPLGNLGECRWEYQLDPYGISGTETSLWSMTPALFSDRSEISFPFSPGDEITARMLHCFNDLIFNGIDFLALGQEGVSVVNNKEQRNTPGFCLVRAAT